MRAALASMEPLDGKCFNRIKNRIYQNFDICGSCPPNSGYAVNFNIRIGAPERFYSGENIALEHMTDAAERSSAPPIVETGI